MTDADEIWKICKATDRARSKAIASSCRSERIMTKIVQHRFARPSGLQKEAAQKVDAALSAAKGEASRFQRGRMIGRTEGML
jgi:hypothetical protein